MPGSGRSPGEPTLVFLSGESQARQSPTPLHPPGLWPASFLCHGIFQARIVERVAIPSSRVSLQLRDRTCFSCVSCIEQRSLVGYSPWDCQGSDMTAWLTHFHFTLFSCSTMHWVQGSHEGLTCCPSWKFTKSPRFCWRASELPGSEGKVPLLLTILYTGLCDKIFF